MKRLIFIGGLSWIACVIGVQGASNADKASNNFMTEDTRQLVRAQAYQAMQVSIAMSQQQKQVANKNQANTKSSSREPKSASTSKQTNVKDSKVSMKEKSDQMKNKSQAKKGTVACGSCGK